MGQKVHPTSLRLYKTNRWSSSAWFSRLYYKETFLKDWFLKKTTRILIHQSKYITPKIFTRFWNKRCDIFVFFLSKRKQYKKILFRFQSFLKTKIKEKKKEKLVFFPGSRSSAYTKFIQSTTPSMQKTKELKESSILKNKFKQGVWQKIEYESK